MSDDDPIKPMEEEPKTTEEHEADNTDTQDEEVNRNITEDEQ